MNQSEWNKLMTAVGRIEAKLETAIDTNEKHDKRITVLERFSWRMQGVAALVAASVTFIITWWKSNGGA